MTRTMLAGAGADAAPPDSIALSHVPGDVLVDILDLLSRSDLARLACCSRACAQLVADLTPAVSALRVPRGEARPGGSCKAACLHVAFLPTRSRCVGSRGEIKRII